MKANRSHLQLQVFDRHLAKVRVPERPARGWIRAVRVALGMSTRQLAKRVGITQQSLSRLETSEMSDAITLKSLRKVADKAGCKLVYALVPRDGQLLDIVREQALKKAAEMLPNVYHTMMLENQNVVDDEQDRVKLLADEIMRDLNSSLWD